MLVSSEKANQRQIKRVIQRLQSHVWVINYQKSNLILTQSLIYLGALFKTRKAIESLAESRRQKVVAVVTSLIHKLWIPARHYMRILGTESMEQEEFGSKDYAPRLIEDGVNLVAVLPQA